MTKIKLDFDQLKRTRMAMMMGLHPGYPEDWPTEIIDRLIEGEQKNGFEWLMTEIKKVLG